MKKLFVITLFILSHSALCESNRLNSDFIRIDFNKLKSESGIVNHDLNQIISITEDSIFEKNLVILPKNVTEFERLLFTARRIQHNDSQLTAIKVFNYILEFDYYRTRGEELYVKLLLAQSLNYIGATRMSINKFEAVFPELLDHINENKYKRLLLNNYARFLLKLEELDKADEIFKLILNIDYEENDTSQILSSLNNVAFISFLNGDFDLATNYFRKIQAKENKRYNPVVHAFSYGNYGDMLLEKGEADSAIFYLRNEIKLLNEIPSDDGLHITYFLLGMSFQAINELDSAKIYFQKSLFFCEAKDELKKGIDAAKELIRISLINLDYEQAKKYLNSYFQLNEQQNRNISNQAAQNEENIADYLEIVNEAHSSKQTFNALEADNKMLFFWVIGLSVILVILLFMGWGLRKSRIKLRQANYKLIVKNKDLKTSYQTISETNHRNETLLKELHHRVKNNLQIISSLFNLQLNAKDLDQSTQEIFQIAQGRIHSISLLHQKIYQSDNISSLNFKEYLRDFTTQLLETTEKDILIDIQVEDVNLSIDSALPLGLIFNELFTNSIKHAVAENGLEITIVYSSQNGVKKFTYTDNGKGVDSTMIPITNNTIGFTLIELLANQIEAQIQFKEANLPHYGFWFSIEGAFE